MFTLLQLPHAVRVRLRKVHFLKQINKQLVCLSIKEIEFLNGIKR